MSLFRLAAKAAPAAMRLIKGAAKPQKTYGTITRKPDALKGIESADVVKKLSKPRSKWKGIESAGAALALDATLSPKRAKRGMRTYGSLSTAGKIRSNVRMFNPMGKSASQRLVGRTGAVTLGGALAGTAIDQSISKKNKKSSEPSKPKSLPKTKYSPKPKSTKALPNPKSLPKPKSTKAQSKSKMKKGVKFGKKYR